jgi:hypothetical protein
MKVKGKGTIEQLVNDVYVGIVQIGELPNGVRRAVSEGVDKLKAAAEKKAKAKAKPKPPKPKKPAPPKPKAPPDITVDVDGDGKPDLKVTPIEK